MSPTIYSFGKQTVKFALIFMFIFSIAYADEKSSRESPPRPFGFLGPEIYKFDYQIRQLKDVDINGDGRTDLALVNNRKARVEFLLQKAPGETVEPEPDASDTINILYDDKNYKKSPLIVDQDVSGLAFEDLNGDGRADMACFGDPKEIRIYFQDEKGHLGDKVVVKAEDGARMVEGLSAGDVTGDGKPDLILTGEDSLLIYTQADGGEFGEPKRIPSDLAGAMGIRMYDVNADGKKDLIIVKPAEKDPIRWHEQSSEGFLGPELRAELSSVRSVEPADLDKDGKLEFLVVEKMVGRLRLLKLDERKPEHGRLGSPERYYLSASKDSNLRAYAVSDLDGDGKADLTVTDPGSGVLLFFRQSNTGGFLPAQSYPAPAGVGDIKSADLDGDKHNELYVLSNEEGTVSVAQYEERGRLSFPRALDLPLRPQVMDLGDLDGNGKNELVTFGKADDGPKLCVYDGSKSALMKLPFTELSRDTKEMHIVDLNQDGRADILLRIAMEQALRVLIQNKDGEFEDLSQNPVYKRSELKDVEFSAVSETDADGDGKDELLVCRRNFVRAVKTAEDGSVVSLDQWNGRLPQSQITGVLTVDLNGDGTQEMLMLDTSDWKLSVMRKTDQGLYAVAENIDVGSIRFKGIGADDFDSDGKPDVILFGQDKFIVLRSNGKTPVFEEIAGWETDTVNGYYDQIAVGDYNGDGIRDVALTEVVENTIDGLESDSEERKFSRAYKFKVFEKKNYSGDRMGGRPEPAEITSGDVTGDGLDDLAAIVHDRVIIYPQDEIPDRE